MDCNGDASAPFTVDDCSGRQYKVIFACEHQNEEGALHDK
jgi:hypothetical protein